MLKKKQIQKNANLCAFDRVLDFFNLSLYLVCFELTIYIKLTYFEQKVINTI
jgi:hypothetical protein